MSFSPANDSTKIIIKFFHVIANHYKLDVEKVANICLNPPAFSPPRPSPPQKYVAPHNKKTLALLEQAREFIVQEFPSMKTTVDKLKRMCEEKGLKKTGTKAVLLERINNPSETDKAGARKGGGGKKNSKWKGRSNDYMMKFVDKFNKKNGIDIVYLPELTCFIHRKTNLVFHENNKRVYAKVVNGTLHPLVRADIDLCMEMGLSYDIPENLDLGVVKVVDKKLDEELNDEDFKDEPDIDEEDESGDEAED